MNITWQKLEQDDNFVYDLTDQVSQLEEKYEFLIENLEKINKLIDKIKTE